MSDKKTYINGIYPKVVQTKYGEILSISINVPKFIEELQKHSNEKGYVNITLSKLKEVGKFGTTHYVTLNDWKPKGEPIEDIKTDDFEDIF